MNGRMTFLHCVCLTLTGVFVLGLAPGLTGVPPENASARDKGQMQSASRLVTSPVNQVARDIHDGGVASGATINFRWLPAQVGSYPAGTTGADTADLTISGAPAASQPLWLAIYIGGWGPQEDLWVWQAFLDSSTLPAGVSVYRPSCAQPTDCSNDPDCDQFCEALMGTGIWGGCNMPPITNDTCSPAFVDFSRADAEVFGLAACNIATEDLGCGGYISPGEDPHPDPGVERYGGTLVLLAGQSLVGGPHVIDFVPDDALTFMNDRAITVKTNFATLTIETGSCCFGIAQGQTASCVQGVSRTDCDGRPPSNIFRTANLCPANGGAPCVECFNPEQPDPACADPIPGVTGDNQCTDNLCDLNQVCQNPPIGGWNQADDCCDPVDGSFTAIDDGDGCTDDSCSLDSEGPGLGVDQHVPSQEGTSCDDDNACTHTDLCGDKDGVCIGTNVNNEPCTDDATCQALVPGTLCCDGFCSCILSSRSCCRADGSCNLTCPGDCEASGGTLVFATCLDNVCDDVHNVTQNSFFVTIAAAIAAAFNGDEIQATSGRFAQEPDIDFAGKAITLRSLAEISQAADGLYVLGDGSTLASDAGSDITLEGELRLRSGDAADVVAEQLITTPGAVLRARSDAGLYITTAGDAVLSGDTFLEPQAIMSFSGNVTANGSTILLADSTLIVGGDLANNDALFALSADLTFDTFDNLGSVTVSNAGFLGSSFTNDTGATFIGYGEFFSDVTNKATATATYIGDTVVVGDYVNNGTTIVQIGTLTIIGSLTNTGTISGNVVVPIIAADERTSPGDGLDVAGDFVAGADASLLMPDPIWRVTVGGNFDFAVNDSQRFDMVQAELRMTGRSGPAQTLELMSMDIGVDAASLDRTQPGHYPIGTLRIGPSSTTVELVDVHDNDGLDQGAAEALYVETLIVESSATLNTNGFAVFYSTLILDGNVDDPGNLQPICLAADPLQAEPGEISKNRAVSLSAPSLTEEVETAIRVRLVEMYVEDDPNTPAVEGCPLRSMALPDLTLFDGKVRYLGPPSAFDDNDIATTPQFVAAELQCTPFYRNWSSNALTADFGAGVDTSTIYYYGAEVVPCSVHEVQQAMQCCVVSLNEACFSTSLEIRTALWGDVWPPFEVINFTDIGKIVDAFKSLPFIPGNPAEGAPRKVQAMLRDNVPPLDSAINFTDIGKVVNAFKTIAYSEDGPTACP